MSEDNSSYQTVKPTDGAMYLTLKWCNCGGSELPLAEAWVFFNKLNREGKKEVYYNFLGAIALTQYKKLEAIRNLCNSTNISLGALRDLTLEVLDDE